MYYIGMVGCPYCKYSERVCVEAAYPLPKGEFVEVCCPIDGSRHRCSLSHMQAATECPPDMKPVASGPLNPYEVPFQLQEPATCTPNDRRSLVAIWLCVAVGAGMLAALMLVYGTPREWMGL
jgi:hypothetical protein